MKSVTKMNFIINLTTTPSEVVMVVVMKRKKKLENIKINSKRNSLSVVSKSILYYRAEW